MPIVPLPYGAMSQLQNATFGHLTLHGLNTQDAKKQLDGHYCTRWPNTANKAFDHKTTQAVLASDVPLLGTPPLRYSKHR